MSNEYEKMKVVLKKSISTATSRLSITLDLWTDKASRPFLVVTGHYFEQSYKLKEPLLSLKWLPKSSQVQKYGHHSAKGSLTVAFVS